MSVVAQIALQGLFKQSCTSYTRLTIFEHLIQHNTDSMFSCLGHHQESYSEGEASQLRHLQLCKARVHHTRYGFQSQQCCQTL